MGLSIHFKLTSPPDTDAARAYELVRAMRERAQGFKQRGRVETVLPIGSDREALRWAMGYKSVPHPFEAGWQSGIEIPAERGFLFPVEVGEDCEPLWLGLCLYPKTVLMGGRRYRTGLKGWQFSRFTKTQYASLHGWEHFRRCHTAVIDLLHGLRRLGLGVKIFDEGDYWPGRSVSALRKELEQMNGVVAAAAGALKDLDEAVNGQSRVQSPIFAHQNFERLEAEGARRMAPALKKLGEVLRKL